MAIENLILTEIREQTATIWLNRPEKHNALNAEMLLGILNAISYLNSLPELRVIIIRGKGNSFCSGADLKWMQQSSAITAAENYDECVTLARCFFEIYNSNKITICLVHGSSFGGANGFIAASDLTVAADSTVFAFSEVRVGVVPATITPYVTLRIGPAKSHELMITGSRFSAEQALAFGLINRITSESNLDTETDRLIEEILLGAPLVQKTIKATLRSWQFPVVEETIIEKTARLLAETRITEESKEGINAFIDKRMPSWKTLIT
jgi:methylglutaconyl-CoA hydratase